VKKYHGKEADSATMCVLQNVDATEQDTAFDGMDDSCVVFKNSDALSNVKSKLSHLSTSEGEEMAALITRVLGSVLRCSRKDRLCSSSCRCGRRGSY